MVGDGGADHDQAWGITRDGSIERVVDTFVVVGASEGVGGAVVGVVGAGVGVRGSVVWPLMAEVCLSNI